MCVYMFYIFPMHRTWNSHHTYINYWYGAEGDFAPFFFLVKNFKWDTPSLDQYVINGFCKYISDTAHGHFYYFYHKTKKINLKEIKKYPRVIDQYSDTYDRIISYSFNTGFFDKTEARSFSFHINGVDIRYFNFVCEWVNGQSYILPEKLKDVRAIETEWSGRII